MSAPTSWRPQVFTPYPDFPDVVFARIAARSPRFDPTCASGGQAVVIGSAAGHRRDQVVAGARGELLERIGNILAGRAAEESAELVASHDELRHRKIPAVDPVDLFPREVPAPAAHDLRPQLSRDRMRALRATRRLWVLGHRTATGNEVYVPAGAAFLHHRAPTGCDPGPRTGSTGLASHPDPPAAVEHAAWEILERDLIRINWYAPEAPPCTREAANLPQPLAALLDGLGLIATVLDLPAPSGTRCVAVCLHTPDRSGQTFGARCGPDTHSVGEPHARNRFGADDACEKAAYEALMVRWSLHTPVAREAWDRWLGAGPPVGAVQHALWAYHRQDSLALWTDATAAATAPGRSTPPNPLSPVRSGVDALRAHTGHDPIAVDTTSAIVRSAGATVVRIVAPGAQALPVGPDPTAHARPHPFG